MREGLALGQRDDRVGREHPRVPGVERLLRAGHVGDHQVEPPLRQAARDPRAERVQRRRGEAGQPGQRLGPDRLAGLLVRLHPVGHLVQPHDRRWARRPGGRPGSCETWLPDAALSPSVRTLTGTSARTVVAEPTFSPRVSSQARRAPATVASTTSLTVRAVRLADPAVVVEVQREHGVAPLLADHGVERALRRSPGRAGGGREQPAGGVQHPAGGRAQLGQAAAEGVDDGLRDGARSRRPRRPPARPRTAPGWAARCPAGARAGPGWCRG